MAGLYVIDGFKHWADEANNIFTRNSVVFNLVGYKSGEKVHTIQWDENLAKQVVDQTLEEQLAHFAERKKDVDEVRWEMTPHTSHQ